MFKNLYVAKFRPNVNKKKNIILGYLIKTSFKGLDALQITLRIYVNIFNIISATNYLTCLRSCDFFQMKRDNMLMKISWKFPLSSILITLLSQEYIFLLKII